MKKYFCRNLIMSVEQEERFEQVIFARFVVNYLRLVMKK